MKKLIFISLIIFPKILYADNHDNLFRGAYSWGVEVHSFTPCNDKNSYWVSFDWAGVEMHEYYKNTVKKPYQLMYIAFRGQILNEVVGGFAADYDGLIRISEVAEYSFKVPAQCK